MKEIIDIGESVICDVCGEDYSNSNESGGWLFVSNAYCPKCATPEALKKIQGYGEEKYLKAFCPSHLSFKDWVLELRGGDNRIITLTGQDFDDWLKNR